MTLADIVTRSLPTLFAERQNGSVAGDNQIGEMVVGVAALLEDRDGGRRLPKSVAAVAEITSRIPATTLLVSVEPCSEPEIAPPRDLFGHHAACRRGAMFSMGPRPDHCVSHREHRSTLASSVVAKQRISWWICSGFERRPTLASSVVTQARLPRNLASEPVT